MNFRNYDPEAAAIKTEVKCLKCIDGCQLSDDERRCVALNKQVKNCVAWTTQQCLSCNDGTSFGQTDMRNVAAISQFAYSNSTVSDFPTGTFYENDLLHIFTRPLFQCTAKANQIDYESNLDDTQGDEESNLIIANCLYQNSFTAQCQICEENFVLDEDKL